MTIDDRIKEVELANKRFAFLMNGIMLIKTRQAGGDKDLGLEILCKRTERALEDMIRAELPDTSTLEVLH